MIVTTAYDPTAGDEARSKQAAAALNGLWVPRKRRSLAKLRMIFRDPHILIVTEREMKYYPGTESPLFFHPSTALLRIKRLLGGETDVLLDAAGVLPGDAVLDCTAGLASDSIVLSYAVGPDGQVTALESEAILYFLVAEGLKTYASDLEEANEAMRRVKIEHAEHGTYLAGLPDRSVDVVYFDPMFRIPVDKSSAMSPLREIANHRPLAEEAVEHACRVARKSVVMKEHRNSREFARLGFSRIERSGSKIAYGVIAL